MLFLFYFCLAGIVVKGINDTLVVDENSTVILNFTISSDTCPSSLETVYMLVEVCSGFSCEVFCALSYNSTICGYSSQDCMCGPQAQQFILRRRGHGVQRQDWVLQGAGELENGDMIHFQKLMKIHVRRKFSPSLSLSLSSDSFPFPSICMSVLL